MYHIYYDRPEIAEISRTLRTLYVCDFFCSQLREKKEFLACLKHVKTRANKFVNRWDSLWGVRVINKNTATKEEEKREYRYFFFPLCRKKSITPPILKSMFTPQTHHDLFKVEFPWEPLLSLKSYFDRLSLGIHEGTISQSATLVNPELITIEKEATIAPGALIEGPCYVGKNCVVGHAAYIRPYTLLEEGCVVGHATEVKHSILLSHAKAPHFNYVGDTILGASVNIGAGVKCSNVRVDGEEISVHYLEKWHETGLKKLGALIGDRGKTWV